ncbi:hypothetical protein Tco_0980915 [Tanacetum coccineum]
MMNTRNNSLEVPIDVGVKQWVTDHVDGVSIGIIEQLAGVNTSIQDLLLKVQYLADDVGRLKGGEGSSRFSKMSKLEFPKFYEEYVKGWMFRIKDLGLLTKIQYMAELKNLMYETSMKENQSQFEKLLNQLDITESQSISIFIVGLPASIELNVRMFRPKSLVDAFSLADLQEVTLAVIKQRNTPLLTTPKTTSGWNANKSVRYPPKSTTTTLALPAPNNQIVNKFSANHVSAPKRLLSQKQFVSANITIFNLYRFFMFW